MGPSHWALPFGPFLLGPVPLDPSHWTLPIRALPIEPFPLGLYNLHIEAFHIEALPIRSLTNGALPIGILPIAALQPLPAGPFLCYVRSYFQYSLSILKTNARAFTVHALGGEGLRIV